MTWSTVEAILTICLLLAGAVFIIAFKFALRETHKSYEHPFAPEIPRAALHATGRHRAGTWHRGASKQALVRLVHCAQAGCIAIGITSVFVMCLCMAGVIASMLIGSW